MGKYEEWQAAAADVAHRLGLHDRSNEPDSPRRNGEGMLPEVQEITRTVLLGAIYSRPGLDLKTRALCTVAALVVLGKEPLLRDWIRNAMSAGATKEEILELIHQMGFYGGMPARVIALGVARKAFENPPTPVQ